jgi:hypothetical protein
MAVGRQITRHAKVTDRIISARDKQLNLSTKKTCKNSSFFYPVILVVDMKVAGTKWLQEEIKRRGERVEGRKSENKEQQNEQRDEREARIE